MAERWDAERVEGLRQSVLARGFGRVLLLGAPELMVAPTLRRPLAVSGVLVVVPGEAERTWLGHALAGELDEGESERLMGELLVHAREHGVDAAVVAEPTLAELVAQLDPTLPLLT